MWARLSHGIPGKYLKLSWLVAKDGRTFPAAGCVVTPVTATVVRTPAATSPGCLARNSARRGLSGLQACIVSQCMQV